MVVVIKSDVPGGIGGRLRDIPSGKTKVLLDGPYGAGADLSYHDTAVLLAGGSGASFITSILQDLCVKYRAGKSHNKRVIVHWVVRHEGSRVLA